MTLSRSLTLSGPLFPCLKFEKNNSIYFIMLLWGLTETPHVKHSAHTNTQRKWVIIIIIIIEGTSQIGFPVSLTSEPVLLPQVTKPLGCPLLSHSSLYCTSQLRAGAQGIDVCWGTLVASNPESLPVHLPELCAQSCQFEFTYCGHGLRALLKLSVFTLHFRYICLGYCQRKWFVELTYQEISWQLV